MNSTIPSSNAFLQVCNGQTPDRTPIWLMRQAGRYLPEYRAIREQHTFMEMVEQPELAMEVTLQPLRRYDLDAAIIFADILPLIDAMGLGLEFIPGRGPVLHNKLTCEADIAKLKTPEIETDLSFTIEAVRQTAQALEGKVPLIGFSGAPFTLACYCIEGGGSKDFATARGFMFNNPEGWKKLMDHLSSSITEYLVAQAKAGANALQLFDSWASNLNPIHYHEKVLPWVEQILQAVREQTDVPLLYFSTAQQSTLKQRAQLPCQVLGIDWRTNLEMARDRVGSEIALQGNLDPAILLSSPETIQSETQRIMETMKGQEKFIFNLGHGIIKETQPEKVNTLIETIRTFERH